jgi:hypothetical protein
MVNAELRRGGGKKGENQMKNGTKNFERMELIKVLNNNIALIELN